MRRPRLRRPEFLASYDQKVMITPNMDKLAAEALVFDKAYCSVAVPPPPPRPSHHRSVVSARAQSAPALASLRRRLITTSGRARARPDVVARAHRSG